MSLFDIRSAFAQLANQQPLSDDDAVALLRELEHFRGAASYLASCQAATLESLPKSTSKSSRGRHVTLCEAAAKLLDGDGSPIRYPTDIVAAKERCQRAANNHASESDRT